MKTNNNERSSRARSLVEEYRIMKGDPYDCLGVAITDDCLEEIIIDLVTDILTFAHMEGIDINSIYRMVADHVSAETELIEVKEEA